MRTSFSPYFRHRFPAEIISHCVWLYFRFALSFRDVEEMLAVRGVVLTYETVREWCLKFGQTYANDLRRRSPRPGDRWHLDEVFLKINGRIHYFEVMRSRFALWEVASGVGNGVYLEVIAIPPMTKVLRQVAIDDSVFSSS